ncbi:DHS-like NAD/FAD-binding domain-containing protein [Paxillus ammoniavirescens]|nr:DHS-like NAD/FAD-binding domain-containing protein [Paxillus ammoniavirescens]
MDTTSLATPEAFAANPSLVWKFYHYHRTKALAARPNPAHETIAKLSIPTYLKQVAPNAKSFHLITQNVDGLSSKSLESLLEKTHAVDAHKGVSTPKASIVEMHGRLCVECGALARPDIVWFGKMPHHMDKINKLVLKADIILVVGTSSTVRPASIFASRVQGHGGKVAIFNVEPGRQDEKADFVFAGRCETVLPDLFPELND